MARRLAQVATMKAFSTSAMVGQRTISLVLRKQLLQKPPSLNLQMPRQGEGTGEEGRPGARGAGHEAGLSSVIAHMAGPGDGWTFLLSASAPRPSPPFTGMEERGTDWQSEDGWWSEG